MSDKSLFKRYFILILLSIPVLEGCNEVESQPETTVEEGYKQINGTEIYYKKIGRGDPIIVVHGGPVLDHGYLVPYFKSLDDDYEMLFYDQRLSGRSSSDVDSADITLANFVEDIEELRKEFEYENIHLVAHSWGGLLAMKYAIKYPSNLNSLILLNSMPASSELWQHESQIVAERVSEEDSLKRQEIISSDLFQTDPPKAVQQLLILSFRNQFENRSFADSLNFYIPDDYMVRSQRFGYLMPELSNYNLHSNLHSLEVPTLLVYGDNEPAVHLSGRELDSIISNSKLLVINNSGHFPFIEQPEEFSSELKVFFDSIE